MTQESNRGIEANNRAIAEFMDIVITPVGLRRNVMAKSYYLAELKYDTSWDWLMPCCQKCDEVWENSSDPELRRLGLRIGMAAGAFNIIATYTAVTEFITYLKEQK